jgi:PAS domain S-box-containing protein
LQEVVVKQLSSYAFAPLREGDIALYRGSGNGLAPILLAAAEEGSRACVERLEYEYALKSELDADWAARPVALTHHNGRMTLVLEDPGGAPLDRLLGRPLEVSHFLRIAIPLAVALRQVHERGLIHKDIKPANILADAASGGVWLTGFGIASRLPRERQALAPPEVIAGTLAYMAPEQTGRMNRSIDSRSDLYALGVTFYEMLTGTLPFTAADPMEWVHCHIARQPVPPDERVVGVPGPLSAIVMKLLAKTAEERYQTAAGVSADLRRSLTEWEPHGHIDPFPLGVHDPSDRLLIPEKLYGREREIDALLAAFDRVVAHGKPELVLVSGYSGVGKSSVVNELHRALVPPRGLFASGKFDQYKRDIPYTTIAQAFETLVRQILAKSEAEVGQWREALEDAVGPNGQLIINLIPEVELVLGKQPPVPNLPPKDAQNRFHMVFRRFLGVFARPEHPLALFLDDLQWLDVATFDLLKHLVTHSEVQHLLLVGAYRENEVTPSHMLMQTLEAVRNAETTMLEIVLAPLELDDVDRLVVDSLHCSRDVAHPLTRLVHEKTGGNPFFAIQFLYSLTEEGLLNFDHCAARWFWDLKRIRAKGYTDNVVDLMVGKLSRLPVETQKALQQLAYLGNSADFALLTLVYEQSEDEMHSNLREAARAGLVLHSEGAYRFLHDRVQEAAYSLTPENLRAEAHLRIGRLLAARTPPEKREEAIFEIVHKLNRGTALIISAEERKQVAELNLIAGRRAKQSTAYDSALTYLAAGRALLPADCWEQCGALTFALEFHLAECEFLTGAFAAAEERLSMLPSRASRLVDFAAVTHLREELLTTLGQSDRAIEVCLDYLRHVGVEWSMRPMKEEVQQEYQRLLRQIGRRSIEELVDLPPMTDPERRATMDVLTAVVSPALFTDENLLCLVICRMANLSLEHGNSDGSCFAYVWLGMLLGSHFGDYRAGFRFGKLGLDLVKQRGLDRFEARVYLIFGHRVIPWTQPIRAGRNLVRCAFDAANKLGDLTFAAYSCDNLITNLLASGDPLDDVQREAEAGLDFARRTRFGLVIDRITTQLRLIRTLRGLTPEFASFNDTEFDEGQFEQHLKEEPDLAIAACWYWIRKLQARFFAGDHASALAAAANAERLLWTSPSFFELAEYHLYSALTRAALCDTVAAAERARHLAALAAHHRQLREWAENCPENFANRAALVAAEIARLEGREFDAERLYEQAIRSARANSFVHNEALANEIAARFYAEHGFEKIARAYLQDAHDNYQRWRADGKVRQLEQLYPYLRNAPAPASPVTIIGAPIERLDVGTVLKAARAVSREIVLGELINTLLRIAVEHAGAERGMLILFLGDEPRIVAEATASHGQVVVTQRQIAVSLAHLPESVLHYVVRTRKSVILDDALAQNPFSADEYIRQKHVRSVLCLPLVKQATLIGVLYLENKLASHVFTQDRISVLEMLASQAAISLENARLYSDLKDREARIRRLVDSNIIGVIIWDFQGRIIEANEAVLDMLGYSREEFALSQIGWRELTPAEWAPADQDALAAVSATGSCRPYEKEYFRKDGSRVPILMAGALFEWNRNEGVAFIIDLSDRKRADEKLRASEQRLLDARMELAHINRVTTTGQLAASIAHEVNQPLAGVIANAEAGLRWLNRGTPDLDAARRSLDWIIGDSIRAKEVIGRVRALANKTAIEKMRLDLNEVVRETIRLVQRELINQRVSLRTELAPALPAIQGDRVHLQQVIINLAMNGIEAMQAVMDRPRELVIRSRHDAPQEVLVSVTDCGGGISAENTDRLFNAFFTTKSSGMGMGLSICRSIVEAHGGRLWATANLPHGATFQFTLPASADSAS